MGLRDGFVKAIPNRLARPDESAGATAERGLLFVRLKLAGFKVPVVALTV